MVKQRVPSRRLNNRGSTSCSGANLHLKMHEVSTGEAVQASLSSSNKASPQMCQVIQPMIPHQEAATRFEGLQAGRQVGLPNFATA